MSEKKKKQFFLVRWFKRMFFGPGKEVQDLLNDGGKRSAMRKALMESSMPDSADRICDIICELAK